MAPLHWSRAEDSFHTNDPKDSDAQKAQLGRARALFAAGKRAEAISLATGARDALAGNTAAKPLADAIGTWLQSVAK